MTEGPRRASYDVIVVGAGIIGLACAWRAAQSGLSVVALGREQAGAGASGVAAGMLAAVTELQFGEECLLRLNLEAAALWPDFRDELEQASGRAIGYGDAGALAVAADRDDAAELRRLRDLQASLGLEVEWLSARDCRRLEPGLSPRIGGGILAPQDHHVDPGAAVGALGVALERAGGELLEGVEAASIATAGGRVEGVATRPAGVLGADRVVLSAGPWSAGIAGLQEGAAPPLRPVKGQIVSLRPPRGGAPRLAQRVVRSLRCYIVSRAEGRVVIGATVEERGFERTATAGGVLELLEEARELIPDVSELEWEGVQVGLRPATPDNGPVIGWGAPEGIVWATGHYRNGILQAPLTGAAVASLLTGGEPPAALGPFGPDRFGSRDGDGMPQRAGGPGGAAPLAEVRP